MGLIHAMQSNGPLHQVRYYYYGPYILVMGNPSLGCGPDLDVAVQYVAEPVTQP